MAETPSTPSKTKTDAKPAPSTDSVQPVQPSAQLADRPGEAPARVVVGDATYAPELAADIPMRDGLIVPTPGDVRTEPVATAAQSHVAGRVGPATVPEDATSVQPAGEHLDEVMPGQVLADTWEGPGPVPVVVDVEDPIGEGLNRVTERVEAEQAAREVVADRHGTVRA